MDNLPYRCRRWTNTTFMKLDSCIARKSVKSKVWEECKVCPGPIRLFDGSLEPVNVSSVATQRWQGVYPTAPAIEVSLDTVSPRVRQLIALVVEDLL